jgi:hypothetical protein
MTTDSGPATIAVLPPGSEGCMAVVVDGPGKLIGRVNALCRGCLRYQVREHAGRIMPTPQIASAQGYVYCDKRIGA